MAGHTAANRGFIQFPTTPGAFMPSAYPTTNEGFVVKVSPSGGSLIYATLLGGDANDFITDPAINAAGEAYVTGYTSSNSSFPTTPGALQSTAPPQSTDACGNKNSDGVTLVKSRQWNGFVSKLNSGGSGLVFSTYLGGGIDTQALSIALDTAGNAYVTGYTEMDCFGGQGPNAFPSTDFVQRPVGSLFKGTGGDVWASPWNDFGVVFYAQRDAFLTVLSFAGQLLYSQRIGGSYRDVGKEVAVDDLGNVYIVMETESIDLTVVKPIQANHSSIPTNWLPDQPLTLYPGDTDLFVLCMKPVLVPTVGSVDPQELKWSTYLGGGIPRHRAASRQPTSGRAASRWGRTATCTWWAS